MSLSMILALTVCPAMLGISESVRDSQTKAKREEHRGRKCNLVVSCVKPSLRSRDIDQRMVVLMDNKLYIDTTALRDLADSAASPGSAADLHPFTGYFLPYPDATYEGLVTTIQPDPPLLNWIYIDKDTHQVRFGVRDNAQPNITGPFDCTKQDRRLIFEAWEGFAAVEEAPGIWALYFDRDDDCLAGKVPFGTRVLEVDVMRREMKLEKLEAQDPAEEAMTLEERFADLQAQGAPDSNGLDEESGLPNDAEAAGKPKMDGVLPIPLDRFSLDDILNSYGKQSPEESINGATQDNPDQEYVPIVKKTPVPGLSIELGTLRPRKKVAFSEASSPPRSPTTTATSAKGSVWSSGTGTGSKKTVGTAITSEAEEEEPQRPARSKPKPPLKPHKLSGVGLGPKGYRRPHVEDVTETAYLARWLAAEKAKV